MALSLVQEPPAPSLSSSLAIPFIPPDSKLKTTLLRTREAQLRDARAINQLIESCTYDGTLLYRAYAEICENISTFSIVEDDSHQFVGCASLHIYGQHLAEIRSIVVRPGFKGQGGGGLLVQALLDQAAINGIECVCLFTRIPAFFQHFHFRVVEHRALPDKVKKDCMHCARRNACDEIAMAIGRLREPHTLPSSRFFRPHPTGLVRLQF